MDKKIGARPVDPLPVGQRFLYPFTDREAPAKD
jgi:hypothetical protein